MPQPPDDDILLGIQLESGTLDDLDDLFRDDLASAEGIAEDDDLLGDRTFTDRETLGYISENQEEFVQALIPIVTAALPSILSLITKAKKTEPKKQSQRPAPVQHRNDAPVDVIQSLVALLDNPQVKQMLANAAGGASSKDSGAGNLSAADILGTIAKLASQAHGASGATESFPDFAFDDQGTLTIDPHDAIQQADRIHEILEKR